MPGTGGCCGCEGAAAAPLRDKRAGQDTPRQSQGDHLSDNEKSWRVTEHLHAYRPAWSIGLCQAGAMLQVMAVESCSKRLREALKRNERAQYGHASAAYACSQSTGAGHTGDAPLHVLHPPCWHREAGAAPGPAARGSTAQKRHAVLKRAEHGKADGK